MRTTSIFVSIFVSTTLLVACGSSDDSSAPKPQAGTVNKSVASSSTQSTISAVQVAVSADATASSGQASAGTLGSAAQSMQGVITPAAPGKASSKAFTATLDALRHRPMDDTGAGCDCTATGCTFTACTLGLFKIDGTYSWGGGHVKCGGLKYVVDITEASATAHVAIGLDCDLTVTATTIDGTFHSTGSSSSSEAGASYDEKWDDSVTYSGVTYPTGGGAPTAGTEHFDGTYSVTVSGTTETYGGTEDIAFPAH